LYTISNPGWDGEYVVNWSDVTGAESYELQEDASPGFSSPTVLYTGADSQFLVMGHEGGLWYYRVRASNAGGSSIWSNIESTGVVPLAPVLEPIENADGDGDYLVDWAAVTNATSYRLEEDDNPEFTSPTVRYTGASTQYQVSGKGPGLWYYRVRASNGFGSSLWSDTQSAGVVTASPVLSPIDDSGASGGYYLVNWTEVTGAISYELQEDDDPDFGSPVTTYSGSSNQAEVTGQLPGTWYYRVRSRNAAGYSQWSDPQWVEVVYGWRVDLPVVLRNSGDGQ
jgi:hypothetical protein